MEGIDFPDGHSKLHQGAKFCHNMTKQLHDGLFPKKEVAIQTLG